MTIRVFEAFSGVGSQRMALRNLGINHEVVAISDVDEFAVKSYAAIHDNDKVVPEETSENMEAYLKDRNIPLNDKGVRKILKGMKLKEFYDACIKSNNLGDISKVVTQDIPDHDLFTYSFPCQDISVAGKGLGLDEGGDTRSGLLWECQKVIDGKKPKYLLLENVKNLVGKKHKHNFDRWLDWLEEQGYTNYWQVLNAKNYGIPQNRERVFVVSILGEHEPYEFPEPIKLELRLKDVLEREVGEKFYLDQERVEKLIINSDKLAIGYIPRTNGTQHQSNTVYKTDAESPSMQARDYKDPVKVLIKKATKESYLEVTPPKIEQVAQYDTPTRKNSNRFRTYDKCGISPSITTMGGGGLGPHIMLDGAEGIPIKNATKKGYINAYDGDGIDLAYPDSKTRRGRVQKGLSQTLDTSDGKGVVVVDNSNAKPIKNEVVPEVIGGIGEKNFGSQYRQGNRVYDVNKIATALTASPVGNAGGYTPLYGDPESVVKNATDSKEVVIGASRGRNKENPSDRTVGSPTEQRLEINKQGTSNTITTVQKDNYVVEPSSGVKYMTDIQEKMMLTDDEWEYGTLKQELFDKFGTERVCTRCKSQVLHSDLPNYDYLCFECDENLYTFETESVHFLIGSTQKNAGITDGDYTTTLTSAMGTGGGHVPMHNMTSSYRIRKLTPLECWRLMGFSDDDFHKAKEVNSNSQLYKQAGNSIVVDVLEGIFKQLLGEKEWNN